MKIQTTILNNRVKITESMIDDTYYIEQADDNKRFYITSEKGYNGYEGSGYGSLELAIKGAKDMIKNYFIERCEENPKGF